MGLRLEVRNDSGECEPVAVDRTGNYKASEAELRWTPKVGNDIIINRTVDYGIGHLLRENVVRTVQWRTQERRFCSTWMKRLY